MLGVALLARLEFSIVDTFAYLRVPSEHIYSPRFESHVFRGGTVPTLLPQVRLPQERISLCWVARPLLFDDVGRPALSAPTSSRINRRYEGTSIHVRIIYPASRESDVVAYPGTFLSLGESILWPVACVMIFHSWIYAQAANNSDFIEIIFQSNTSAIFFHRNYRALTNKIQATNTRFTYAKFHSFGICINLCGTLSFYINR